MKKINGFMLYILLISLLLISTLAAILIKNSSLDRKIETYYDDDYRRYLLSYRYLLKSLDEQRDKWISVYNKNFANKNFSYEKTINLNINDNIKAISYKNFNFHLNIKNLEKNKNESISEATVSYIPNSILESENCVNISDVSDLTNDFIDKVRDGEKLNFTSNNFKSNIFSNSNYKLIVDNSKITLINLSDLENKVEFTNDKYLYLIFKNSKVSIESLNGQPFYGILQCNTEIEFLNDFILCGTLISTGNLNCKSIQLRGVIFYESINDLSNIKLKELNIRQVEKIDDLITLDITSFI